MLYGGCNQPATDQVPGSPILRTLERRSYVFKTIENGISGIDGLLQFSDVRCRIGRLRMAFLSGKVNPNNYACEANLAF
jgi:hypothetical protein